MARSPQVLIILDGWGIAPAWGGNAISLAETKCFSTIWKKYPSTTILASGDAVGLPTNTPGNSEAGHLNIGAGRVVRQDVPLIDGLIDDGTLFSNKVLLGAIDHAKKNCSKLHLIGLLSKTGTHSHISHLYALLRFCKENKFDQVYIHLFSDGRDSDPMSGIEMVSELEDKIREIGVGKIVSITGRYFAMDRDNRWGRVSRAYNLLVKSEGNVFSSAKEAFSASYSSGVTDEFIEPRLIGNKVQNTISIQDDDAVISFNFRSDRIKELVRSFLDPALPEFPDRTKLSNLYFVSFAIYDDEKLSHLAFHPELVAYPLARVLAENGLSQFHIAETEKYPHVTYFVNGGTEKPFTGEQRLMIPSVRNVKTYDYAPKMSAGAICQNVIQILGKKSFDFILINFANADMVGHTGNLESTTQAVSFVDECLEKVLLKVLECNGTAYIMADHGNAEQMINPRTGNADTEHTTNPVPFIIVSEDPKLLDIKLRSDGILASVAPTILEIMGIEKPAEMANQSLVIDERVLDGK